MKNKVLLIVCNIIIFFILLFYINNLFLLKDTWSSLYIKDFYNEKENTMDFIFFGSSTTKSSVIPAVLYRDFGYISYDFGGSTQPIEISYYFIKEAIKKQPQAIMVFNIGAMNTMPTENNYALYHTNIDFLPFKTKNKIIDIMPIKTKDKLEYYFPLLRHRTGEIDTNDGSFLQANRGYNPYCKNDNKEIFERNAKEVENVNDKYGEYLLKIINLSKKQKQKIIIIQLPIINLDLGKKENMVEQIAKENDIPFINFNKTLKLPNHPSVDDAEKITIEVGKWLKQFINISDKREDKNFEKWGRDTIDRFKNIKRQCEEYGRIFNS
jgi:hypothetical protein